MDIEFIMNPETGILEAWEDGKVIGEFVTTEMLTKGWKLMDCIGCECPSGVSHPYLPSPVRGVLAGGEF